MILCVNANAAIDKTVVVPGFHLNGIQRPEWVRLSPGGKGCNVARALKRLGGEPVVSGWVGGHAGAFIEEGLKAEGIGTAFVQVPFESRTCLSIVDPQAPSLTELYERGEAVSEADVARLVEAFAENVGRYEAVTLSGSLPPGAPPDLYATLIGAARAAGVPVLLDSSGVGLAQGLPARPDVVKPNVHEFEELTGATLRTPLEVADAALEWSARMGCRMIVSMGAEGAVAVEDAKAWLVTPPAIELVSAVGSGDSLVAGSILGLTRGEPLPTAVARGVAAGAANALSLGAAVFTLEAYHELHMRTTVRALRP